jgi:hypothetical protein
MRVLRIPAFTLAAGLAVIAMARVLAPLPSPPLYDGVITQEPYRYLSPATGQAASPTSFSATQRLRSGASRAIAAATAESPPQAQLIALAGAFATSAGTTTLQISIAPVEAGPPEGIAGNVYRFSVTDQDGASIPLTTGSAPTLVLRAPPQTTAVAIVRLVAGSWQELPTQSGGQPDVYLTNVDGLGDFAIRAVVPSAGTGFDPWLLVLVALLAVLAFGLVTMVLAVFRPRTPTPAGQRVVSRSRAPRRRRGRRR